MELQQLHTSQRLGKEAHEKPNFTSDNRKEVPCEDWYSCWEKQALPVSVGLVPARGCLYLQKVTCSSLPEASQQLPGYSLPWHEAASLAEILPASSVHLFPLKQDNIEHHWLPNIDPPQGLHRLQISRSLVDPGKSESYCLLGLSSTSCTIRGFGERGRKEGKQYFNLIVA